MKDYEKNIGPFKVVRNEDTDGEWEVTHRDFEYEDEVYLPDRLTLKEVEEEINKVINSPLGKLVKEVFNEEVPGYPDDDINEDMKRVVLHMENYDIIITLDEWEGFIADSRSNEDREEYPGFWLDAKCVDSLILNLHQHVSPELLENAKYSIREFVTLKEGTL